MKKLAIALAISAVGGSALAAGAFDGPYVQIGIGGVSTEVKTNYNDPVYGVLNQYLGFNQNATSSGGSFIGQILGGYSQSIDRFNIAGNIFYNIGNQNAGTNSFGASGGGYALSMSQGFKLKNTWGLSVEPGFYVADKTLGYLKFSWFNASLDTTPSLALSTPSVSVGASTNTSNTVNGAGFGIGAKQMFTENIFGFVEYQYVTYGSVSDNNTVGANYKPNQNYGLVGVGYKF